MSQSQTQSESSLDRKQRLLLAQNQPAAHQLPPSNETWLYRELEIDRSVHRKFIAADLIEVVDTKTTQYGERSTQVKTETIWRTKRETMLFVERELDPDQVCPKGEGQGIHTVDPEDDEAGYTCQNPDCDCRFGSERAQEMVSE